MEAKPQTKGAADLDIVALWRLLWQGRWLVIGITGMFIAAGVSYALLAKEKFRAEVIMSSSGQRSIPNALNQLGGLAALAGVSIGSNNVAVPVAVLQSRGLAKEFIEDMKIQDELLKGKSGDDLDARDAVTVFVEDVRTVFEERRTGIVTLTIEWTDPTVAADWANKLVARLNDRLRSQALEEAERNVAYLRKEMAATDVVSQQQSIGRVLEAEMQKLLLARGNDDFALKILDRATPPKKRSSPKRTVIVIVAAILGFLVSVSYLLGRRSFEARSTSVS
jgi:uncharacterized protein involved in exopolysaccharide biosynthesis